MKRLLLLFIPLFIGLAGCSDQLNTNDGEGEIIEPVFSQDLTGDDSSIILMDVPGVQELAKSVLIENGLIEDYTGIAGYFPDLAMVVNNKEMLKDVVVTSNMAGVGDHHYQWPEIDFEKYSIVIGQVFTVFYHFGNIITQQYIVKGSSKYVLYLEIGNLGGLAACKNNYFAALYPKLPDVELEVKRLNKLGLTQ